MQGRSMKRRRSRVSRTRRHPFHPLIWTISRPVTVTTLNVRNELVALPETVPFSHIVYGESYVATDSERVVEEMMALDLREWAAAVVRALFAKYIEVGSELELNLSHKARKRSLKKLGDLEKMDVHQMEQLLTLFLFLS